MTIRRKQSGGCPMIGKVISHFRILDKLGEGAMGEVYLAEDTDLGRRVALKFIPPSPDPNSENRVRLLQEARIAASLNHSGICTVYEIGETDDGRRFIAMENISGQTLEDRLAGEPLEVDQTLELIRKTAQGLAHAHAAGIIHRDIKTSNIMITSNGEPKILDFGLARLAVAPRLTRPGTVMGTMAYMSPEQVQGEDPDQQSDIWALGVVFYQMLTGVLPFKGEFDVALVYSITHDDPTPLDSIRPELSTAWQKVLDRMLARDKTDRYANLEDFLHDLEVIADGGTDNGLLAGGPKRRGKWVPRLLRWSAIALIAGMAVWGGISVVRNTVSTTLGSDITMAVLPLTNLSGDPDQDYFADGFTGELIAGLTRVVGLNVIARSSVLDFRDSDLSVKEIAEKLGVDKVVTGTIQQEGKALRVTIEIIDIAKGLAMWANTFNGLDEEVLQLQGSMARSIVEVLKGEVTEKEEQLFSGAPKIDPEAYRAYLKGNALAEIWGSGKIWNEALGYYREAARIEPGFAPAYAAQSRIYNFMGWFSPEMGYPSMCEAAAREAIDLDPDLPEANAALAHYLYLYEHRWDEAQALFTKAMELDPGNVEVLMAYAPFLWMSGQCDEGIRLFQKAADLDPLNYAPSQGTANALLNCGKFEECIQLSNVLLDRFQGETTHLEYFMAFCYAGLGKMEEAMAAAKIAKTSQAGMANVYWLAGRKAEAWNLVGGRYGDDPSKFKMRALLFSLEGDYDQAIDLYEQSLKAYPALTTFFILTSFAQEPLKDAPRFQELMRSINVPGY
jgi:serine/threonine protein kinase/tetratricopeptide (TPR) repeat protein